MTGPKLGNILPRPEETDLLRRIVETGIRVVGAQEGSLLLYDGARQCLVFSLTAGNPTAEIHLRGQTVPLGEGITGLAAATLDVQIGATTYTSPDLGSKKDGSLPDAVLAAPMVAGERLLGVVTAVSFQPGRRFGSGEARSYAEFARLAGSLIEHWRAVEQVAVTTPEGGSPLARVLSRLLRRPGMEQDHLAKVLEALEPLLQ